MERNLFCNLHCLLRGRWVDLEGEESDRGKGEKKWEDLETDVIVIVMKRFLSDRV